LVAHATEEVQHGGDCEAITVYGDFVVTGADDGKIKIWDRDLKLLREVQASEDPIQRVVVSNNIVFGLSYREVKGFDFESLAPKNLAILPFKKDARCLKAYGDFFYVGDDVGHIHQFELNGLLAGKTELMEPLFDLYMTPERIFSVRDRGITVSELRRSGNVSVASTLRGSYPMTIWNDFLASAEQEDTSNIVVYNKDTYKKIYDIQGHEMIIQCMCGWDNWLASGSYDKKLKLWDMNNGKLAAEVELPYFVMSAATSGDGCVYVGLKFGSVYKVKVV